MAKSAHADVQDFGLNTIKTNATRMCLCSAEPTTYTQAITTFELADVTMASGDFTIANGDTSGRKITVAAKTAISVDASGTGTHVALVDVTNSKLLFVTTCASQAVSVGGTCDIGTWKDEIAAPA